MLCDLDAAFILILLSGDDNIQQNKERNDRKKFVCENGAAVVLFKGLKTAEEAATSTFALRFTSRLFWHYTGSCIDEAVVG